MKFWQLLSVCNAARQPELAAAKAAEIPGGASLLSLPVAARRVASRRRRYPLGRARRASGVTIVIGGQWGDEGKGSEANRCCRHG